MVVMISKDIGINNKKEIFLLKKELVSVCKCERKLGMPNVKC